MIGRSSLASLLAAEALPMDVKVTGRVRGEGRPGSDRGRVLAQLRNTRYRKDGCE